jgi:hypothetical protein
LPCAFKIRKEPAEYKEDGGGVKCFLSLGFKRGIIANHKNKKMTENNAPDPNKLPEPVTPKVEKYPAMVFVAQFSRLCATILAFAFVGFALLSIFMGIFSEDGSFLWGLVNAGFYLLIGSVLVGLVRGMGEVFELLLELDKKHK